jgi:hypothetical protein
MPIALGVTIGRKPARPVKGCNPGRSSGHARARIAIASCGSGGQADARSSGEATAARGRDERVRLQQRWVAEWGDFRFAARELVYLGVDRGYIAGRIVGSGLSSGAAVDSDWAVLVTLSAGRVIREQFFFDHGAALEPVGLGE